MEEKKENEATVSVWVNKNEQVISFKKVEGDTGFMERIFPSHDEMMKTIFHMGSSGYRFQ